MLELEINKWIIQLCMKLFEHSNCHTTFVLIVFSIKFLVVPDTRDTRNRSVGSGLFIRLLGVFCYVFGKYYIRETLLCFFYDSSSTM